jgi:hypothetical protein
MSGTDMHDDDDKVDLSLPTNIGEHFPLRGTYGIGEVKTFEISRLGFPSRSHCSESDEGDAERLPIP